MKIIDNKIVVPDGSNSMIISWSGTSKLGFFTLKDKKLGHMHEGDVGVLSEPGIEPIDILILHVIKPKFTSAGSPTPNIKPDVLLCAIKYNFEEFDKTELLVPNYIGSSVELKNMFKYVARIRPGFHCPMSGLTEKNRLINMTIAGGYVTIPALDLFDQDRLKKFFSKFKTRVRKL